MIWSKYHYPVADWQGASSIRTTLIAALRLWSWQSRSHVLPLQPVEEAEKHESRVPPMPLD